MGRRGTAAFFLCISAFVFAASASAATTDGSAKTDSLTWFKDTTKALHDAVTTGQSSVWARVLDDKFMMTTEDGLVLDKKALVEDITPLPPGFSGGQTVRDLTVQDLGDAAVVHFWIDEWENVFGDKLQTTYVETDTYRRRGSAWSMVAAHVTVVPRDLAPVSIDTSSWAHLTGSFGMNGDPRWVYKVYEQDGKLYGSHSHETDELIPLSPLVYYEKGTIHILVFVPGANGTVDQAFELHKYNEVMLRRLSK